ncbi:transposase [Streptomyces sindenensis]|uniref:transposase n=1 Tax=Streptomyces sindenensis TaxID=67363 RepID=UPI00365EE25E
MGTEPCTTVQIREVIERLVAAGQCKPGDPEVVVALDSGYDAPRIAHLLGNLPVEILGRLRSDRVCVGLRPHAKSSIRPTPRAAGRPSTAASSSSAIPQPGAPSRP